MMENCETAVIRLRKAPIETPGTIGQVEGYNAPLLAAFKKVRTHLDRETSYADCLTMAVYAVNCTVGPEVLWPTLLVFGAIPRPLRTRPSPQHLERAETIDKSMNADSKEQDERRISFGLSNTKGPKGM